MLVCGKKICMCIIHTGMKKYYIYQIYSRTDTRKYIGVSLNPSRRFKEHEKSKNCVGKFIKTFKEDILFEIIATFDNEKEAYEYESILVPNDMKERLNMNLLNKTGGGNRPPKIFGNKFALGIRRTQEQKLNISEKMKEISKKRDNNYYIRCRETLAKRYENGSICRKLLVYKFIDPNGNIVEIQNLKDYCKIHKLNYPGMVEVHNEKRKSHKKYFKFKNNSN